MSLFNWNGVRFPGFTMQQLNLDWILTEIKRIMGFFPEEGNTGAVLMKTDDGSAWEELPAIDININGVPEDTELTDTDKLIFYDLSASANRKITAPNLLNSMMSNGTPLMDGTGSAGTSKKPARYDHRHPTDTSRQAALNGTQMAAVNSGITAEMVARINRINTYTRLDAQANPSGDLLVIGNNIARSVTLDDDITKYASLEAVIYCESIAGQNRTQFTMLTPLSTSHVLPIATTTGVGWIRVETHTDTSTIDFVSSSFSNIYLAYIFGDHI